MRHDAAAPAKKQKKQKCFFPFCSFVVARTPAAAQQHRRILRGLRGRALPAARALPPALAVVARLCLRAVCARRWPPLAFAPFPS
jgi:hypothetical protein